MPPVIKFGTFEFIFGIGNTNLTRIGYAFLYLKNEPMSI